MKYLSARDMKAVPTFHTPDGHVVQFFPVSKSEGVLNQTTTHRVIIDGIRADWLSKDFKPNATSAAYYANKHFVNLT